MNWNVAIGVFVAILLLCAVAGFMVVSREWIADRYGEGWATAYCVLIASAGFALFAGMRA